MSSPSEFIASVAHLPVNEQIERVMAHTKPMRASEAIEFVKDEGVKEWISKYASEINATMRIPKSHGGPG